MALAVGQPVADLLRCRREGVQVGEVGALGVRFVAAAPYPSGSISGPPSPCGELAPDPLRVGGRG